MATSETKQPEQWLAEFHTAMGVKPLIEEDAYGLSKGLDLRMRLITEEFHELMDELLDAKNGEANLQKIAKEAADLVVVIVGTAQLMEIPFTPVFEEVMRSNMSKVAPNGQILYRADGKVLKGPNYRPADLSFMDAS